MRNQIDILREVFLEWLILNNFDHDYWVYSKEEWKKRQDDRLWGEPELVFIFEHLYEFIYGYRQIQGLEQELEDLFEGFGFSMYWEFQVCGFYPIDNYHKPSYINPSYQTLLSDKRWQKKRERILERCIGICENCGTTNETLEIHHCYYRYGRYPWQYPDQTLLGLCGECHEKRHEVELKWRLFQPQLTTEEIINLKKFLENFLCWHENKNREDLVFPFQRKRFLKFIKLLSQWSRGFNKSHFFNLTQEVIALINDAENSQKEN